MFLPLIIEMNFLYNIKYLTKSILPEFYPVMLNFCYLFVGSRPKFKPKLNSKGA